ncbi:MAG: TldD/PmbA family protein [candidate division Zixibacteria bacterium]|nr:TldD/PmbA family protein [candidate division Zixibacteria bacterium]
MLHRIQVEEVLNGMIGGFTVESGELVLLDEELNLTRFAESFIQQNISRYDRKIMVRAIEDKKAGVAVANQLDTESILKAIRTAESIAKQQKPDAKIPDIIKFPPIEGSKDAFYNSTTELHPGKRADAAKDCAKAAKKQNMEATGAYQTNIKTTAVANTAGTLQYFTETSAWLSLSVSGDNGISGWAQAYHRNSDDIKSKNIAKTAVEKAALSSKKTKLPPGEYTVILEPAAVADLVLFLSFLGFGAKTFLSRRSFMSGKIGEKITGDNITITEDPIDNRINYMPFDYEGVPKKKVPLIENGAARGVVSNRYYAAQLGEESTGNALPPDNNYGPYPKSMVMSGGNSSIDEMIKSTQKGILVTHWWYINFLNPMKTEITGTCQDGTLLIENGKVVSGIEDMRIGQSILEAFSNVEALSSELTLCPKYGSLLLVPALKINNFKFIG